VLLYLVSSILKDSTDTRRQRTEVCAPLVMVMFPVVGADVRTRNVVRCEVLMVHASGAWCLVVYIRTLLVQVWRRQIAPKWCVPTKPHGVTACWRCATVQHRLRPWCHVECCVTRQVPS